MTSRSTATELRSGRVDQDPADGEVADHRPELADGHERDERIATATLLVGEDFATEHDLAGGVHLGARARGGGCGLATTPRLRDVSAGLSTARLAA